MSPHAELLDYPAMLRLTEDAPDKRSTFTQGSAPVHATLRTTAARLITHPPARFPTPLAELALRDPAVAVRDQQRTNLAGT